MGHRHLGTTLQLATTVKLPILSPLSLLPLPTLSFLWKPQSGLPMISPHSPCLPVLRHVGLCGVPCLLLLGVCEDTNFLLYDSYFRVPVARSWDRTERLNNNILLYLIKMNPKINKQKTCKRNKQKIRKTNKSGAYFKTSLSFPK